MDRVVLKAYGKKFALFKKGSPVHKQCNINFQTASSFKYADFVTIRIYLGYVTFPASLREICWKEQELHDGTYYNSCQHISLDVSL
jgi:hypothetical protein